MSPLSATEWGTHAEFAQLYESYIDAVYRSQSSAAPGTGRWKLIHGIAAELRARNVRTVLDCAAGTGFPAFDLATDASLSGLVVHCSDADLEMLDVLDRKAKALRFDIGQLAPPVGATPGDDGVGALRIGWQELGRIRRKYDYVMCRGNALAYADTWDGGRAVASTELVRGYLENIAAKVDGGGYIHVDAPWRLQLPQEDYEPVACGAVSIQEHVTSEPEYRHWRVDFEMPHETTVRFERFSKPLTIYEVKTILDDLEFEETDPFPLLGERPGFGAIIARKLH